MYFVQSNLFSTQGIKYYVYPLFINLDNSNWILHVHICTTNFSMWSVLSFYYKCHHCPSRPGTRLAARNTSAAKRSSYRDLSFTSAWRPPPASPSHMANPFELTLAHPQPHFQLGFTTQARITGGPWLQVRSTASGSHHYLGAYSH